MLFRTFAPSAELRRFVRCYWILDAPSLPGESVLPDGCTEIVFQLGHVMKNRDELGRLHEQPKAVIVGQMLRATTLHSSGRVLSFGVRFQPAGLAPFLRVSISELTGSIVECPFQELQRRIDSSNEVVECIRIADEFFLGRLSRHSVTLAEAASTEIERSRGVLRIDKLCRNLGVSPRTLQRSFEREVGIGPKAFARIVRLQAALRLLDAGEKGAEVAADLGYFDQAHLLHDRKEIVNGAAAPRVAFLQDSIAESRAL
ncbi:MAG TPA: helix-turn-helix transcriptional regulator [Bryobacteraceae bacterium]|jgi:AraC-like DNA-binding protein|nr:helix-turn-helix transcriptional regulator [Bryobacteraceae bacterium]